MKIPPVPTLPRRWDRSFHVLLRSEGGGHIDFPRELSAKLLRSRGSELWPTNNPRITYEGGGAYAYAPRMGGFKHVLSNYPRGHEREAALQLKRGSSDSMKTTRFNVEQFSPLLRESPRGSLRLNDHTTSQSSFEAKDYKTRALPAFIQRLPALNKEQY